MRLLNFLILTFLLCVAVVYTQGQNNDNKNNNNTPQTTPDTKPTNIPNNNNNNDDQKKKEEEVKKKKEEDDKKKKEDEEKKKKEEEDKDKKKKEDEEKKKKEDEGKKGNEEGKKGNDDKDKDKNKDKDDKDKDKDDKDKDKDKVNENEWEDFDMDSYPKVKDSDDVIIWPIYPVEDSRTIKSGQKIKILWQYREPKTEEEKKNFIFKQKDIKEIQIALMTGSNLQQVFIQNVTNVDAKTQSVDYTMPRTNIKGKVYFFRFLIISKDPSKKIEYASTTRFDFYNTDKGTFVEINPSDVQTETFGGSRAVAQTINNGNSSAFTLSTVVSLCFSFLFVAFAQL